MIALSLVHALLLIFVSFICGMAAMVAMVSPHSCKYCRCPFCVKEHSDREHEEILKHRYTGPEVEE